MKKNLIAGVLILLTGPLLAADSSPKDDVKNAAAMLGNAANYTWHTTVEVPEDAQFKPGPTDGKTEKDGYTMLTLSFNDNTSEAIIKGTNVVVKTDADWQSASEATANSDGGGFNPAAFIVRMAQNYRTPAVEAANLADLTKDLKAGANGISGELTEDGAKSLLAFRRRGGGATVTNPKGTVTFWVTDGKLTKYQNHVTGSVDFNGNSFDVDRTTTVEIKDVNTTKIDVPDDAKKKLQ